MTKTVSQGESRSRTPEPQIALRFPKGTSYRVVKAALHKLAAELELATPDAQRARAVRHEQAPESTGRLARPTLLVDRKRDLCKMARKFARQERSRARDAR